MNRCLSPGRFWASFCAGRTPSEKPTWTSCAGNSSAAAVPRAVIVSNPAFSA
ncbi:hypothetical protein [Streptomyces sp. TRM49041]|uniref:hypothetical protein n=1 Tax=Streptomyces sp. TRM49041 TaxID=2603216 RepID=UPI00165685EE|nr:hypothetical protein [Streptomyces sp. TRM49041]